MRTPWRCTGYRFDEAWTTRETTDLDGSAVHFIAKDMLLKNKQAAGRPKDLADVARLKR